MEGLLNLGLNAWLAQVMYLFAEIKQLTQYMQSECFFNDFSIMNSAILLKVVSFIVYSWVSSVNSVLLSKHTLYTFYSKERVFSTLYFVFEILLLLRVIVLNIPSKMSQLHKSGSEFYSIEKWHFLQCMLLFRQRRQSCVGVMFTLFGNWCGSGWLQANKWCHLLNFSQIVPSPIIIL